MSRLSTQFRFAVLPWQTPGLLERAGLTERQCMETAWYVDAVGQKYRGAAAVNAALGALGGVYAVAASLYRVPGLKQLEDLIYQ